MQSAATPSDSGTAVNAAGQASGELQVKVSPLPASRVAMELAIPGRLSQASYEAAISKLSSSVKLTLIADWRKADDDCCAEVIGTLPTGVGALALAGITLAPRNGVSTWSWYVSPWGVMTANPCKDDAIPVAKDAAPVKFLARYLVHDGVMSPETLSRLMASD